MNKTRYFSIYALLALALIMLACVVSFLGPTKSALLLAESGPIEQLSALGYFCCVFYMAVRGGRAYLTRYSYVVVLITLFGCRELDFDKRFTTMGVLKSRFYLSTDIPIFEKLIGLIVIALIIWSVAMIVRNHIVSFLEGLRLVSVEATGVAAALLLLGFSKSIDGVARKLAPLGVDLSGRVSFLAGAIEEVMELGIPLFMIIVFHAWNHKNESLKASARQYPT